MLRLRRTSMCFCGVRHLLWRSSSQLQNIRYLSTSRDLIEVSLKQGRDSVEIKWNRKDESSFWSNFHHLWLRDNCQCPECYHSETHQRLSDIMKIGFDLRPKSVELNKNADCIASSCLTIEWEDGHRSVYPTSWLQSHSYDFQGVKEFESKIDPTVWGKEISKTPPIVSYDNYMQDDHTFLEWSDKVDRYGFCFIDGIPLEPMYTKQVLERSGVLRNTFYGQFWDIKVNAAHDDDLTFGDTAYTSLAIDSHTDCNYFQDTPGLQMFHVLYFNGTGGESILVDGFKLAEVIKEESPYHYQILSTVPLNYQYKDKNNRYLSSFVPFKINPETGQVSEIHFNNCDRFPISASTMLALHKINSTGTVADIYGAIQTFTKTMRQSQYQYRFVLEPGRAVIFDNHRLLHARTSFTKTRRLYGGYVNKEDWKSRVLVAKERLANCS